MQRADSLWSTAEFMRQWKRRGFMMSLDLYHVSDIVHLLYVDRVLPAMGFGNIFREVVANLYSGGDSLLPPPPCHQDYAHFILRPQRRPYHHVVVQYSATTLPAYVMMDGGW
jgi:hypothetical protein